MRPPQSNPSGKIVRRRAGVACMPCRKRKVRCDVSQRGAPCAICFLDDLDCQVRPRANRRNRGLATPNVGNQVRTPSPSGTSTCSPEHDHIPPYMNNGGDRAETPSQFLPNKFGASTDYPRRGDAPGTVVNTNSSAASPSDDNMAGIHEVASDGDRSDFRLNGKTSLVSSEDQYERTETRPDVLYTHYGFLNLKQLPKLPVRDVNTLETRGCLRVPTRDILDEFLRQYFCHVHPFLPVVHEGDFWAEYTGSAAHADGTSLLLLQAMLFASCSFVPLDTLRVLGFGSMRAARAELHRKAKLLYDLKAESSSHVLGQAALLLSFWPPSEGPRGRRSNTSWLMRAIEHARGAGAHSYASPEKTRGNCKEPQASRRNSLKRLWWSCIIRDRVISLALRRQALITRDIFDFESNPCLEAQDLADEVHRSRVYSSDTKQSLIEVVGRLAKLCVILTDLLSHVGYPENDGGLQRNQQTENDSQKALQLEHDLQSWYDDTSSQFPPTPHCGATQQPGGFQKHCVKLFSHTIYLYYHSALASLSQNSIVRTVIATSPSGKARTADGFRKLRYAVSGFADCMQCLTEMRLVRWLPMSAIAFSVLPLLMYTANLDTASDRSERSCGPPTETDVLGKKKRLNILTEAIKTIGAQYSDIAWFSTIVQQASQLAQPWAVNRGSIDAFDGDGVPVPPSEPFLRLVLTADLSLSTGDYPDKGKLPVMLRSLRKEELTRPYEMVQHTSYAASMNPTDIGSWADLERLFDSSWANVSFSGYYETEPPCIAAESHGEMSPDVEEVGASEAPDLTLLSRWIEGEDVTEEPCEVVDPLGTQVEFSLIAEDDLPTWGSDTDMESN